MSDISTISGQSRAGGNYTVGGKTDRGTSIVEAGGSVDKNAFLQILVAELSNLDPTADTDSTQYISQLAQFSTMEQMSNLNTTMSNSAAYNLVGKGVTVNVLDNKGIPYTGIVRGVSGNNGTSYTVSIEVYEDNQTKYIDVPMSSIQTVLDVGDSSLSALNNMNTNIAMMTASSYIGKYVELTESKENGNNEKVTGQVMSVSRENGAINIKVKLLDGVNGRAYAVGNFFNLESEAKLTNVNTGEVSFNDVLNNIKTENEGFILSKHACKRFNEISFSRDDMNVINNGFDLAKEKGAKNAVFIYKDVALIANIKNRTIITAVEKERAENNVFTNIDSVVIL